MSDKASNPTPTETASDARLISVTLDAESLPSASAEAEHDRRVAIFDLLEQNSFRLVVAPAKIADMDSAAEAPFAYAGPYRLSLGARERGFWLRVSSQSDEVLRDFILSLTPFRQIIRDYLMVCDSYYQAIRSATPSQIEAIDMGRRGLHNEGAALLRDRLSDKIAMDSETARRLFTLLCALRARN